MAEPQDSERLTFDTIGIREALANKISDVTPEEYPFLSNCGSVPNPGAVRWDWLTQSLVDPVDNNLALEGDNFTTIPVEQPTRLYNYMQISSKALAVSKTQEAVSKAGRGSDIMRGMLRKGIELKRDMDKNLLSKQARAAGNASTVRKTSTLMSWIPAANTSNGGGAAAEATADGSDTRTDGTQRVFTETLLKDALSKVWVSSGVQGKRVVYLGEVNLTRASGFIGLSQSTNPASDRTIYGVADIYKGQHETVYFIPERQMRARDCFIVAHAFTKIAKLRDFAPVDLPTSGDNVKKALVVEYGFQVDNPLALGGVFDLTES